MPYTPPSRSPAASNANSPQLSRNQSYEGSIASAQRPGLPRSRSAAYIQKHRRAPSISDHGPTSAPQSSAVDHSLHTSSHQSSHSGLRNSVARNAPAAVDYATGEASIVSPLGSSDEEEERGRGKQIQDLADSLKAIHLSHRTGSPDRRSEGSQPAAPRQTPAHANGAASPALTPEARKIAHSRSSSEIQLSKLADVPSQAASSDDSDEEELMIKPPLLRKKSGELVKPALRASSRRRPSSMPGTPTFSKAVHFNEDIEQVRHFLQVDRPMAVSAGSSPVETYDSESEYPFNKSKSATTEWEIRLANFPQESWDRSHQAVRVERIFLAADQKMLVGVVAAANISFQKHIVARFTFDYWKTTSEVVAEYNHDIRKEAANDGYDRFNFNIKLADQAHLENKTLLVCIRYNVADQEHWDNNGNMNYQIDFIKKIVPRKSSQPAGAGTLGSIPRSRHTPPTANTLPRPKSFPAANDDEFTSTFEFGAGTLQLKDPNRSRGRKGSLYPTQQKRSTQPTGGPFGTRYDFGASLSAALTRAQTQLGPSGIARSKFDNHFPVTKPVVSSVQPRTAAPAVQPVDAPNPAKLSSERPELGSQEYHDLIQKFCYFGSKTGSPGADSPITVPKRPEESSSSLSAAREQSDGAHSPQNDSDESEVNSVTSSASNSPPSEREEPRFEKTQVDGTYDVSSQKPSRSTTPLYHPSTSPRLIAQYRSPSPAIGELPFQVLAQ